MILLLALFTIQFGFAQGEAVKPGRPNSTTTNQDDFNKKSGTFTDSRDGSAYKYVKIGSQVWMSENLKYNVSGTSWAYEDKSYNVNKYGRLYTWESAKYACPTGWHLPSDAEWNTLEISAGLSSSDADNTGYRGSHVKALVSGGYTGFNATFAGFRLSSGSYSDLDKLTYYWSSTTDTGSGSRSYERYFYTTDTGVGRNLDDNNTGFAVRCVKNQ